IHTGPAVVGRMGWGESLYLTAVGDTVHVAARLEQATKDYAAELVVSDDVARRAGLDLSRFPGHDVAVRNRAGRIAIRVIDRAAAGIRTGAAWSCRPHPHPRPSLDAAETSGSENSVVATVLTRRVHHPLHALGIRPRRQLARRREHEARPLTGRVDAALHFGL